MPPPKDTPPPAPAWSDNLTVTSLMQFGSFYTATVVEKDGSAHYLIRSDSEDPDSHLMLASVRWADKPEAVKVTIRKGTQFGEVRFDPAASSSSGPAVPGAPPSPLRPGVPNPAANFRPPPPSGGPVQSAGGGPPGNAFRGRPVIRANPPAAPSRPIVTPPAQGANRIVAPVATGKNTDDDDDDDN